MVLFSLFFNNCFNNSTVDLSNDETGNKKIVAEAQKYLKGNPKYFIPTGAFPPGEGTRTNIGPVAWTPSGYVGEDLDVDTREVYLLRLNNAGIIGQTHYNQYQKKTSAGYPGLYFNYMMDPAEEYQAGYVCYAYVFSVYRDAGYPVIHPVYFNINTFLQDNGFVRIYPETENIKNGDLVAYLWDNDDSYDHIAIVTNTSGFTNVKDYTIISSNGIVDYFKFGVNESKVDAYNKPANGGIFEWWDWPRNEYHFYRKN